jgi:hypothetical protein
MPQLPSNSTATITEENEEETARGENNVFEFSVVIWWSVSSQGLCTAEQDLVGQLCMLICDRCDRKIKV